MRRLLALFLLPLLLLTACGGDSGSPDGEASPSDPAITDIADLEVSGDVGQSATVDVAGGFETDTSVSRVVSEGTGAPLQADQAVRLEYAIFNASTGEQGFESYSDEQAEYLTLSPLTVIPSFVDSLAGVAAGSRVVVAVPPGDTAATPNPDATTAIFVLDIEESFIGRATGAPVPAPTGLPAVALGDLGKPTITLPAGQEPPAELLVQPLVTGAGPAVAAGQTVTAMYTGLKWVDGSVFDSTWEMFAARDFPVGVGGVIPAWDIALVGQTVGSQVLMVVPPTQGYGEAGRPEAGIAGTDTLVFVVDILDARQV